MADLSIDLRRKLVAAYKAGRSGTYDKTAALFGVGRATVSRNLRRLRETGDVQYKPKGGNNPRRVDLDWLRRQCKARPDDRIVDRIKALVQDNGEVVSYGAMWRALHAIGWSFKKKRQ
jgi:transposase